MTISMVVRAWRKERLRESAWKRRVLGYLLTLLAFGAVACYLRMPWFSVGMLLVSVAVVFGLILMPPELHPALVGMARTDPVPDTLLAKLADAPDVPERIKVNIAKELQRDGSITFGFLLDLEEQRAKETWRKQQEAGTGFQKMLAIVESMGVSKSAWSCHAYPLQRITIQLQGTRHSERNSIIAQLDTIKARLLAGDINGTEHDDDFGYSFEVQTQAHGPSIFDEPCGV